MAVSEALRAAIVAARGPGRDAIARWQASPAYRRLDDAFAGLTAPPAEDAEAVAARAEALLGDGEWVAALLAPLVAALAGDVLFEPPFKVTRDPLRIGALLYQCPAMTLTASVTDHVALAAVPSPAAIVFSGRVAVVRTVRSGGACVRRWRAEPIACRPAGFAIADAPSCVPLPPVVATEGAVHRVDGRREARLIESATEDVVTLAATVRSGADALVREYDAASGRLIRVASADDCLSRTEMLLTLLRVSGRADAGECFAAASRDPAFHLRWAAMREWLALDAAAALPRLAEMAAGDPHPEVRVAAGRTLPPAARAVAAARCRG